MTLEYAHEIHNALAEVLDYIVADTCVGPEELGVGDGLEEEVSVVHQLRKVLDLADVQVDHEVVLHVRLQEPLVLLRERVQNAHQFALRNALEESEEEGELLQQGLPAVATVFESEGLHLQQALVPRNEQFFCVDLPVLDDPGLFSGRGRSATRRLLGCLWLFTTFALDVQTLLPCIIK